MRFSTTGGFFEGGAAEEGAYCCTIIPKELDEDHKSVQKVGHRLLKLLNEAAGREGPIAIEGVSPARFQDVLLDFINGDDSRPVLLRFSKSAYTPDRLADLLREYFPRKLVRDVTIDGQSIYREVKEQ